MLCLLLLGCSWIHGAQLDGSGCGRLEHGGGRQHLVKALQQVLHAYWLSVPASHRTHDNVSIFLCFVNIYTHIICFSLQLWLWHSLET